MPRRVALATWDRSHPQSDRDIAILRAALAKHGIDAEPIAWTRPHDLSAYDGCMIHSTWDFPERLAEFRRWVREAQRATRLWNPEEHVAWNLHKSYLLQLRDRHGV